MCSTCGVLYAQGDHIAFLPVETPQELTKKTDTLVIVLKEFFKRFPFVYFVLANTFGALILRRRGTELAKEAASDAIVINVGSGPVRVRSRILQFDYFAYENVDVVADISHLPMADNSVDVVICEYVLEHVKNPGEILREIVRVLKPGGVACVAVPFVATFHSAPDDYFRWTRLGLTETLRVSGLNVFESGVTCGPTSAFFNVTTEWLAVLFSFGISQLYGVFLVLFMIILSPLKLLDFVIYRFPQSQNLAHCFYALGKKGSS